MAVPDNTRPSPNFHVDYMDVVQHWHPGSESFAGGDALVTFLSLGWVMHRDVYVEQSSFAGMRAVSVYHVTLTRDGETLKMPIVRNPYINRVLRLGDFRQIPMNEMELG